MMKFWQISLYRWIILLVCIFYAGMYIVFFYQKPLVILPDFSSGNVKAYSDADNTPTGESEVLSLKRDSLAIQFSYILHPGFFVPYAGFTFQLDTLFDLSGYNRLRIEARGDGAEKFYVQLLLNEKKVRDQQHPLALRHMQGELVLNSKESRQLRFKTFQTPDWWLAAFNFNREDLATPGWSEFRGITFGTANNAALGKVGTFQLVRVEFYQDRTWAYLLFIPAMGLTVLISYVHFIFHRRKEGLKSIVIHYKALEAGEKKSEEDSFFAYIHQHYSDPELTLVKISEQVKVPARIISACISEKFNTNVKTYINQIRIIEAQRLLKESDLNISEIGYMVGFNSPSQFSRVYKSITGKSPTGFLEIIDK